MQISEEQQKSIEAAKDYLKVNKLDVGSQLMFVNLGLVDPKFSGIFGFTIQQAIIPVTEAPIASPLQADDLAAPIA